MLMALARSGCIPVMRYIKLLIIEWYKVESTLFSSVVSEKTWLTHIGVETGLESSILNLFKMFSQVCCCEIKICLRERFREISSPKKWATSPQSVILKLSN